MTVCQDRDILIIWEESKVSHMQISSSNIATASSALAVLVSMTQMRLARYALTKQIYVSEVIKSGRGLMSHQKIVS